MRRACARFTGEFVKAIVHTAHNKQFMSKLVLLLIAVLIAQAQEPQLPPGGQRRQPAAPPRVDFFGLGPAPDPAAVERGQKVYISQCGFCHGSSGKGGNGGPDLIRSVVVLHDEGRATEVGPVIREGRPTKGMPKFSMPDTEIKDVAAFLQSLIRGTVIRRDYKILNLVTGDATAGLAYFRSHCASCHSTTGDLAKVGTKFDPPTLLSRFLNPRDRNTPRSKQIVTVTLRSGQSVSGEMSWIDDFSVALIDSAGQLHSWSRTESSGIKVAVQDPLEGHEQLLRRYTDADMHNILSYLVSLQ